LWRQVGISDPLRLGKTKRGNAMKVHVIYDSQGNIISLGAQLPPAPTFGPQAKEGQHGAELEVPAEHAALGLIELAEKMQVDTKGHQPRLIAKRS
jgi:hypothetical protein